MRYWHYLATAFRMSIFRSLEYRAGVLIELLVDTVWYVVQFALLRTAYNYVPQVGGYKLHEAYLFLAFLYTYDAINMIFFSSGIDHFARSVRNGGLEFFLIKPMPTLFQMTMLRLNLPGILNLLLAAGFWIFVCQEFEFQYSLDRWLWATVLFLNGIIINVAFRLAIASLSFWTVQGGSLNWLTHELLRFGTKPESVYSKGLRFVLTSFLPVLLVTAWPCMVLIRETTGWEKTFPFIVASATSLVLILVWKVGVRRYEGLSFQS